MFYLFAMKAFHLGLHMKMLFLKLFFSSLHQYVHKFHWFEHWHDNKSLMYIKSIPDCSQWTAREWRRQWGDTTSGVDPGCFSRTESAYFFRIWVIPCRDNFLCEWFVNSNSILLDGWFKEKSSRYWQSNLTTGVSSGTNLLLLPFPVSFTSELPLYMTSDTVKSAISCTRPPVAYIKLRSTRCFRPLSVFVFGVARSAFIPSVEKKFTVFFGCFLKGIDKTSWNWYIRSGNSLWRYE